MAEFLKLTAGWRTAAKPQESAIR